MTERQRARQHVVNAVYGAFCRRVPDYSERLLWLDFVSGNSDGLMLAEYVVTRPWHDALLRECVLRLLEREDAIL